MTHPLPFAMYPDEKQFYSAVEDYIRTGYNSIEKIDDPMHRRAVGFILTTFQKLNASSFQAIKAALEGRLARLGKKLEELPEEEEEDRDERFQGELDERDVVLKTDREIPEGRNQDAKEAPGLFGDAGKENRQPARTAEEN